MDVVSTLKRRATENQDVSAEEALWASCRIDTMILLFMCPEERLPPVEAVQLHERQKVHATEASHIISNEETGELAQRGQNV